jgi:hypothetical protein
VVLPDATIARRAQDTVDLDDLDEDGDPKDLN